MKKMLFSLAVLLFFVQNGFSQLEKRSMIVGGSASASFSKSDDNKNFSLNLRPKCLVFLMDNLAVGGDLGGGFSKSVSGFPKSYSFSIGPDLRYYFLEKMPTAWFGEISGRQSWNRFTYNSFPSPQTNKTQSYILGLSAGCNVFFNKNVALEASLNYDYRDVSEGLGPSSHDFYLSFGIISFIGRNGAD